MVDPQKGHLAHPYEVPLGFARIGIAVEPEALRQIDGNGDVPPLGLLGLVCLCPLSGDLLEVRDRVVVVLLKFREVAEELDGLLPGVSVSLPLHGSHQIKGLVALRRYNFENHGASKRFDGTRTVLSL